MTALVLVEREGAVARLVLNRPGRHNSLVPELLHALLAALDAVDADDGVKALVLAHAGPSFSTGGDVAAFYRQGTRIGEYASELVGLLNQAIVRLAGFDKPVVAAVDGAVTGGALGLVLACDIVLVSARASFTPYYVDVGFSPDGGWTAMLPSVIGSARARAVQLQNLRIGADQALDWGLAARLVAPGAMAAEAMETAVAVAAKVAGAVRRTRCLLGPEPALLAAALERERVSFLQQVVSQEAQQGMQRFLFPENRTAPN